MSRRRERSALDARIAAVAGDLRQALALQATAKKAGEKAIARSAGELVAEYRALHTRLVNERFALLRVALAWVAEG